MKCMRRGVSAALLALGLSLSSVAYADVPLDDPPTSSSPTAPGPKQQGASSRVVRPVLAGLIAALFLIMGSVAGNDKKHGDKKPSA